MTLTTEQLRARAKFWREKAVEAKWESVSIAQDMLQNADAFDEFAANREAQPVGYAENGKGFIYPPERRDRIQNPVAVFTAPPTSVNALPVAWEMRYWNSGYNMWGDWERITAEQHAEMSVQHAAGNDYEFRILYDAPPAPAVPDDLVAAVNRLLDCDGTRGHFSAIRCGDAREEVERLLAQPVSGGYKLPGGWIACSDRMPDADGAYWCWFGKEKPSVIQQRVCIWNDRNHEWCDSSVTHWMPLPAAPTKGEKQ